MTNDFRKNEDWEKPTICEHCGNIVDTTDLQEGTLTCFWCWQALRVVFPLTKPFKKTKAKP